MEVYVIINNFKAFRLFRKGDLSERKPTATAIVSDNGLPLVMIVCLNISSRNTK